MTILRTHDATKHSVVAAEDPDAAVCTKMRSTISYGSGGNEVIDMREEGGREIGFCPTKLMSVHILQVSTVKFDLEPSPVFRAP